MRLLRAGNDVTIIAPWLGMSRSPRSPGTSTSTSPRPYSPRPAEIVAASSSALPASQDGRTIANEMSTPRPEPTPGESLELPVDELLRRGRPHLPYGEQVIDDLTPEEAEAFLDAILS